MATSSFFSLKPKPSTPSADDAKSKSKTTSAMGWLPASYTGKSDAAKSLSPSASLSKTLTPPKKVFNPPPEIQTEGNKFVHVVRVLESFTACVEGQISLTAGQLLLVTRVGSRGWYFGHPFQVDGEVGLQMGMLPGGWFPAAYVVSQGGSSTEGACTHCQNRNFQQLATSHHSANNLVEQRIESRMSAMLESVSQLVEKESVKQVEDEGALRRKIQGLRQCIAEHTEAMKLEFRQNAQLGYGELGTDGQAGRALGYPLNPVNPSSINSSPISPKPFNPTTATSNGTHTSITYLKRSGPAPAPNKAEPGPGLVSPEQAPVSTAVVGEPLPGLQS